MNEESRTSDASTTELTRRNGLLVAPRGIMAPVFTVFLWCSVLSVLVFVATPYLSTRYSDSPWQTPERLAFLGQAVLAATVFGLLVAVTADRRGRSAWWYLAGVAAPLTAMLTIQLGWDSSRPLLAKILSFGAGASAAIVAQAFIVRSPAVASPRLSGALRAMGRIAHAAGNIWFGIALLVVMIAGLMYGGFYESAYGAKAARAAIYTGMPFGLLFIAFTISLVAATLRKYPWRVSQAGWLVTHLALVLMLVGSFMSFWGKQEGELGLVEGEKTSEFELDTATRLVVRELFRNPSGEVATRTLANPIADFDLNPKHREFVRPYHIQDAGSPLFRLVVDRYYAHARPTKVRDNENPSPRAGVEGAMVMDAMPPQAFGLAEGDPGLNFGNLLQFDVRKPPTPAAEAALQSGRDVSGEARLLVKRQSGELLAEFRVREGARPENAKDGPAGLALDAEIPGTGCRIKGRFWFDNFQMGRNQFPIDQTPGEPWNPAVGVTFEGPKGQEHRWAFAWYPGLGSIGAKQVYEDLLIELDYFPVPRGHLYLLPRNDETLGWAWRGQETSAVKSGTVSVGGIIDLGLRFRIRIDRLFDRYRERDDTEFLSYGPERQAIRVQFDAEELKKEEWIFLGGRPAQVTWKNRFFEIAWQRARQPLGFEIELQDFVRGLHAGSNEARTFESHLWLRHETRDSELREQWHGALGAKPEGAPFIKIDMNHPLRLDGWRLFQARFAQDAEGGGPEATFLQVNRDPGLPLIYLSSALLVLALVIVFFQKPYLRALGQVLDQANASNSRKFFRSLTVVFWCFVSTIPGLFVILVLPEGPGKGIGVILIALGLIAQSVYIHFPARRRLLTSLASPVPPSSPSGA